MVLPKGAAAGYFGRMHTPTSQPVVASPTSGAIGLRAALLLSVVAGLALAGCPKDPPAAAAPAAAPGPTAASAALAQVGAQPMVHGREAGPAR